MENFANYIMQEIGHKLPAGTTLLDITKNSYRYSMYKVGPVLSISVSPSYLKRFPRRGSRFLSTVLIIEETRRGQVDGQMVRFFKAPLHRAAVIGMWIVLETLRLSFEQIYFCIIELYLLKR